MFYWLTVLFTFALGTVADDLTAERRAGGSRTSALLLGALIAATFLAHSRLRVNAMFAFWIAYILTRPLGASIGDYLSQARADGGLSLVACRSPQRIAHLGHGLTRITAPPHAADARAERRR